MRYIVLTIIFALLTLNIGCGKKNYFLDPAAEPKQDSNVYKVNKKSISLPTYFDLQSDKKTISLDFEKIGSKPVNVTFVYGIEGWVNGKGKVLSTDKKPIGVALDFVTGGAYEMPLVDIEKYIANFTKDDLTEVEATESDKDPLDAVKVVVIDVRGIYNKTELQYMPILNNPHSSTRAGSEVQPAVDERSKITPEMYKDIIIMGKPLITAAANGQQDRVVKLLAGGANINEIDTATGDNALFKTIKIGDKDLSLALIDKGIDLKHLNKNGQSGLHVASEVGFYEISKKLLEKGVNINAKDSFGNSPIIYAAGSPNPYLIDLLALNGARIEDKNGNGETPILIAALAGNTKSVDNLQSKGASVQAKDNDGNNIIMKAVVGGNDFTLDKLIGKGVGIDTPNNNGVTPLHVAVRSGNVAVAEKLLSKGADINKQDPQGNTPLILATLSGNLPLVKKILEFKPDVAIKNNEDKNAYVVAADRGLGQIQRLLADSLTKNDEVSALLFEKVAKNDIEGALLVLTHGAKIDTIDMATGNTPLFTAVANNYEHMVKKLIEKRANVNHRNIKGNTALIIAVTSADLGLVDALIQAKTDVNLRNTNGDTALIWAVKLKKIDMVRALLKAGSDPNTKNNDGVSPFLIAYNEGTKEILALLQAAGGHR